MAASDCTFGFNIDDSTNRVTMVNNVRYNNPKHDIILKKGDEIKKVSVNSTQVWPNKSKDTTLIAAKEKICNTYPTGTVIDLVIDPNSGGYGNSTTGVQILLQNSAIYARRAAQAKPCRIGIQVSNTLEGLRIDNIVHGGAVDNYNTEHGTTFNEGDIISQIDKNGPKDFSGLAPENLPILLQGACNSTLDIRLLDKYDYSPKGPFTVTRTETPSNLPTIRRLSSDEVGVGIDFKMTEKGMIITKIYENGAVDKYNKTTGNTPLERDPIIQINTTDLRKSPPMSHYVAKRLLYGKTNTGVYLTTKFQVTETIHTLKRAPNPPSISSVAGVLGALPAGKSTRPIFTLQSGHPASLSVYSTAEDGAAGVGAAALLPRPAAGVGFGAASLSSPAASGAFAAARTHHIVPVNYDTKVQLKIKIEPTNSITIIRDNIPEKMKNYNLTQVLNELMWLQHSDGIVEFENSTNLVNNRSPEFEPFRKGTSTKVLLPDIEGIYADMNKIRTVNYFDRTAFANDHISNFEMSLLGAPLNKQIPKNRNEIFNNVSLFDLVQYAFSLLYKIRQVLGSDGWPKVADALAGGGNKSAKKQKTRRLHRNGHYNSRKRYD